VEQLWTAEDMNKLKNLSENSEALGMQQTFFIAPQICLRRKIIVDNTTKSNEGQTVFTPGNKNCSTLWCSYSPTGFRVNV
jgi:hypothetical protein